jgi:hypothetical protein
MGEDLYCESQSELLASLLPDLADGALLVNPSAELVRTLAEYGRDNPDDMPALRVLGSEAELKAVRDDFLIASAAADLVEQDLLEFRVALTPLANTLVLDDDTLSAIIENEDAVAGLAADDAEFITSTSDQYHEQYEQADAFNLRTPGITRVLDTLETELSASTSDDFEAVLDSRSTVTRDDDSLDEIQIAILVAAKNEQLLYDLSKWGEDEGLASKATFSRTKGDLEEAGLIDTEKVPIDVGRPRLRLQLGHEDLVGTDASELADAALDHLA